jgi:hypothetical protein
MRNLGLLVLLPAVANGAGFYMSVNGTKSLLEGGAFVAEADDLSAIQHNPGGLAQQRGFSFLLDGQLLFHPITFQREDPGFDPSTPSPQCGAMVTGTQPVCNLGGPFPGPMFAVAYGLPVLDRTLTIALGAYGPPSVGHYAYPAPDYTRDMNGKYVMDPRKFAPQRYTLIDNNILIFYPTLSIAYALHPKVMLGISIQPVLTSFNFSQAITSSPATPTKQSQEDPIFDSVVHVSTPLSLASFTGIIGVLVKPVDLVSFGVSFRPPVPITTKGTLKIDLGEAATALMTSVNGDQSTLQMTLPMEIRAGVRVQPLSRLGINFDFVYEGWQSVQQIVLTPQNVMLQMGNNAPTTVAPFIIHKGWGPSYQFHLGAGYKLFPWLSLHAGAWYETGAIPDSTVGIDFLQFAEVMLTGGIGVHYAGLDIYAGVAGSPSTTHAITNSTVRAGSTDMVAMGGIIGNGLYTSSTFVATLGIRGNFGGKPKENETPPAPQPPPATTVAEVMP